MHILFNRIRHFTPENISRMEDSLETTKHSEYSIIIKQFVQDVIGFSSQYGSDVRISYTAYNITGKPSKYPEYGDFPQAFVMRTYGKWWSEAPSATTPFMLQSLREITSQDYIDLEFEQAVYPIEICIYETYNPGSVIRIWAANSEQKTWSLLWEGEPQCVEHVARKFIPELKKINFLTRFLRLEFHHLHLEYYTEIDAVMLIGTKELNYLLEDEEYCSKPQKSLLSQIKDLNIISVCDQDDLRLKIKSFLNEEFPLLIEKVNKSDQLTENLKEVAPCYGKTITCLPNETILKIFSYLDLKSLCQCCQVNKLFRGLATDIFLYKELNFKEYWYCVSWKTLESLVNRCSYLRKLDLSWCGSFNNIKSVDFIKFLDISGGHLTHLRLNSCKFVDDETLNKISLTCSGLKELSIQNCLSVTDFGFRSLQALKEIEYLNLYRTNIVLTPLKGILESSNHLKHLNIGSCIRIEDMDSVAKTMALHNKELISVDLWKATSLTTTGIKYLSECSKLEEVDFGWCLGFGAASDCLHSLAKGCPRLRKLFLAALRNVSDRDLELFIQLCPNMEQIDLMGVRCITPEICLRFLTEWQNLRLLDISFCDQIQDTQVVLWKQLFPSVSIKRSFQSSGYHSPPH